MLYRRARVRIETDRHVVEGVLQLPGEGYRSRLTDFLNAGGTEFIALTDAELTRHEGVQPLESHRYLAVSVRHVVLAMELESLGTVDDSGAPPSPAPLLESTPPPGTEPQS
jgi:hypothetical protein